MNSKHAFLAVVALGALACSSSSSGSGTTSDGGTMPGTTKSDAEYQTEAVTGVHDSLAGQIADLLQAAKDLQAAAPTPTGRGWDATMDAAAIQAMKDAWRRCRVAYEHFEGAIAPLFPDIDNSIDARYDDFLTQLGGKADPDLFDDQGVTGMHAIERILYSNVIPSRVVDFEKTLPGYSPAAFPTTEAAAQEFKMKLCAKLIADVTEMLNEWMPAKIDIGVAFQGLISLMNEQREKVVKASTGEEESRYAQLTLFDLRNNLEGTANVYMVFQPWIQSKMGTDPTTNGPMADTAILGGFMTLKGEYDGIGGDAIPQPPATWSSLNPTAADLMTPFGQLFSTVKGAVDPNAMGSIVFEMNLVANMLGFPQFKQG